MPITGKSSGTGKYSFHARHNHNKTVQVSLMPEDHYKVRITTTHNGEQSIPIIKMDTSEAEMLWAALNGMAKDLGWKDYES